MSNTQYPYDSNPGQTHFDGCWRERKHHNCAVDEIKRLRARLESVRNERDAIYELHDQCVKARDNTIEKLGALRAAALTLISKGDDDASLRVDITGELNQLRKAAKEVDRG